MKEWTLCPVCDQPTHIPGRTHLCSVPLSEWRTDDVDRARVLTWCLIAFVCAVVAIAASAVTLAVTL